MKSKTRGIIIISIILLVIGLFWFFTRDKQQNQDKGNIMVGELEISNITKQYEQGITTIRAEVTNKSSQTKDVNLKIMIQDEKKQEIKSTIQIVEQIEPNKKKVLLTGITGDYSKAPNIEIKQISDAEMQQY